MLATFDRNVASPLLEEGKSYLLVVEQSDGSELKMLLQASASKPDRPTDRRGPVRSRLWISATGASETGELLSGLTTLLLVAVCGLVGSLTNYSSSFFPALGGPNGLLYDLTLKIVPALASRHPDCAGGVRCH